MTLSILHRIDPLIVMHLAAFTSVAALALQDQLRLRLVLLLGIFGNCLFHIIEIGGPSWPDIFWDAVGFGINVVGIIRILLDKTHIGLSREQEELFQAFDCLSPGEFRQFLRTATWATADRTTLLTRESERPDRLFYVLRGSVDIHKAGRTQRVGPRIFIGEIAFLRGTVASATVEVSPGTRYVIWSAERLNRFFAKRPALRVAVLHLLSHDMALKVARS